MSDPETRVVRLRRRGHVVLQDCDVYIGRRWTMGGWNLEHSRWANPFTVRQCGSAEKAVARYREWILQQPEVLASLEELRGKTLGCWCVKTGPDGKLTGACHGRVLIELLNEKGASA